MEFEFARYESDVDPDSIPRKLKPKWGGGRANSLRFDNQGRRTVPLHTENRGICEEWLGRGNRRERRMEGKWELRSVSTTVT